VSFDAGGCGGAANLRAAEAACQVTGLLSKVVSVS
jgi:hypothetical protein